MHIPWRIPNKFREKEQENDRKKSDIDGFIVSIYCFRFCFIILD